MTVASARALAATLDEKAPGHLITAADWNNLVAVLIEYGAALDGLPERVGAAEDAIEALAARVDALDGLPDRVQALEDETAPLRANYLLSVRTAAENFLVGQVAEIVFRATALDGSALTGPRPWLDVVTTWGRLRAAPGFTVRENAEENALSVQFNAAGEVRVQLRSQYTRGFTAAQESGFQTLLAAQVPGANKSAQQVLSEASSPQDAQAKAAFKMVSASYDANAGVRNYADGYVAQYNGGGKVMAGGQRIIGMFPSGEWQNYRATVMAFAKPDASPTTPDPTRGVATVQVNFREWISHWSDDYVHELSPVLSDWSTLMVQNVGRVDAVQFVATELERRGQVAGALGQVRHVKALDRAAELINPAGDPAIAQTKSLLRGMAQMQFAVGATELGAASGYAQQAQATNAVGQTARAAQAAASDAASTKQSVAALENRVKATEQAGREIGNGLRALNEGVGKINAAEVTELSGKLAKINVSLGNLANRIGG